MRITQTHILGNSNDSQNHNNLRKSSRMKKPPTWMIDYTKKLAHTDLPLGVDQEVKPQFSCFLTSLTANNVPTTFKHAVKHPYWIAAMYNELEALERNDTWVITTLSHDKHRM